MKKDTSNKVIIALLSLIIALLVIIYVIPTYTQTDNQHNQQDRSSDLTTGDTESIDDREIEVEMEENSSNDFQKVFDKLRSIDSYKATSKGGFDVSFTYDIEFKNGNLIGRLSDVSNLIEDVDYAAFSKIDNVLYSENEGGFWQKYDNDNLPFITLEDALEDTENIEIGLKEEKSNLVEIYDLESPDPDYYYRNEIKVLTPEEFSAARTLENNIEIVLVQGSGYHVSCLHHKDYTKLPENEYGYLDTCLGNRAWFFDEELNLISYEENWFESFDEFKLLEVNPSDIEEIELPNQF